MSLRIQPTNTQFVTKFLNNTKNCNEKELFSGRVYLSLFTLCSYLLLLFVIQYFNLSQPSAAFHIYIANEMSGFYIKFNSGVEMG